MQDAADQHPPDPEAASIRYRFRVTFSKDGPARYISHLDLARVWERLLRRARVGLSYSQGFTPRAHLHLAAALPLGYASDAELLDLWTTQPWQPADLEAAIRAQCPEGLVVSALQPVPLDLPGLQISLRAGVYRVDFLAPPDLPALRGRVSDFLASHQHLRERRGKRYDLRPRVLALEWIDLPAPALSMTLAHQQEAGSARADEVIDALAVPIETVRVRRTALILAAPEEGTSWTSDPASKPPSAEPPPTASL